MNKLTRALLQSGVEILQERKDGRKILIKDMVSVVKALRKVRLKNSSEYRTFPIIWCNFHDTNKRSYPILYFASEQLRDEAFQKIASAGAFRTVELEYSKYFSPEAKDTSILTQEWVVEHIEKIINTFTRCGLTMSQVVDLKPFSQFDIQDIELEMLLSAGVIPDKITENIDQVASVWAQCFQAPFKVRANSFTEEEFYLYGLKSE